MLIYLYSKNLGLKGGGVKSSLITKKYINLAGHECISFTSVKDLKKAIGGDKEEWRKKEKGRKPDLILHHNIVNMYSVLRISKKYKVPLIVTVNGLITCGRGFHYMPNKTGFGKVCTKCSFVKIIKCSILSEKGLRNNFLRKIKLILSAPIRFFKIKKRIYCLNKADAVIAVGSTLKNILIKNGVKNKIYVCQQPIDDDFLKQSNGRKYYDKGYGNDSKTIGDVDLNMNLDVISHFNKSKKKKIILAGGLFPEKGALVFLKAFDELNVDGLVDDVEVFIIGKVHPYVDYSAYKPFMKKNVHITGKVSLNEMKNFYKKADFLAYPNILLEPFGRVWAEAVLYKCPVLTIKDRGGANDYLVDGHSAYFCDANLFSLKKGIMKMLNDSKFRKKIANEAYKYGVKNLIGSVVGKKLNNIFKDVIKLY